MLGIAVPRAFLSWTAGTVVACRRQSSPARHRGHLRQQKGYVEQVNSPARIPSTGATRDRTGPERSGPVRTGQILRRRSQQMVAWGIELPNGSAISLSIDDEAAAVCTTAGHCEPIQSAELIWIDRAIRDSEQGSSR